MMTTVIKHSVSVLFYLILSLAAVQATTYTRTFHGDWSNSANWDINGVPPSPIGATDIVNTGDFNLNLDIDIVNNGVIEISNGAGSGLTIGTGHTLTNNNIIRTAAGTDGAFITIEGILTNSATINTENDYTTITLAVGGIFNNTGTFNISNCQFTASRPMTNNGIINITSGGSIVIDGSFTNAGTITNTGGFISNNVSLFNIGTINNEGIYFGLGSFAGSVFTNGITGEIGLGYAAECFSFQSGFTNNGQVHIIYEGATAACTDYSQISVTGTATLGGDFDFNSSSGYPPVLGDIFTILTATSITGQFATSSIDLASNPSGIGPYANVHYTPTAVNIIIEAVALPIELLNFDAVTEGDKNKLMWATASETNNKGFEVERSNDGNIFQCIGNVKALGAAGNYNFTDIMPINGINHYRLRQIDNDGMESYSKVISVFNKGSKDLRIYPNIVSDELLTVDTDGGQLTEYSVTNMFGQQVLSGNTTQKIDVSALANGTYMLKVGIKQAKFIKK